MKNVLLLATGLLFFGCESTTRNSENVELETENNTETDNADESVEIGSGTEISPQLEGVEDSSRLLEVDPINSAKGTEQQ